MIHLVGKPDAMAATIRLHALEQRAADLEAAAAVTDGDARAELLTEALACRCRMVELAREAA